MTSRTTKAISGKRWLSSAAAWLQNRATSLRLKLVAPIALGCLLLSIAALWAVLVLETSQARARLRQRAELVARTVNYAAETIEHERDLQRLVNSLSAEDGVSMIVVAAGTPTRVIASTRNEWIGRMLRDLPQSTVADDLAETIRTRRAHYGYHAETGEVDSTVPLLLSRPEGAFSHGAVMVHVDASTIQSEIARSAAWLGIGTVGVTIATLAGVLLLIHRVVLRPIERVARAVATNEPIDPRCMGQDELGALGEALNESRWQIAESRRELRRLAEVAERTANAVIITDAARRVEWVNPAFVRMSGYTLDEVRGRTPGEVLQCERTDPATVERIRAAVRAGGACQAKLINRSKSGTDYIIELDIQPIRDDAGRLTGFMSVQNDVTEKEAAAAALARARDEAEAANRAKSEFLANMSHEIRTPMTAILGYADLLDSGSSPEHGKEHVRTIKRNGQHLLSLINDILDISKIEAGRMTVEPTPTLLPRLLLDVESLMSVRAREKSITLSTELRTPVPAIIHTDPVRLRQILVNLVGNAIKFTETGGVRVVVGHENGTLRIDVNDTGIGIAPDQITKLFRAFAQADTTTTRRFGGTGLGLRISKCLAELMGGEVRASSEPGRGSTFSVLLPVPLAPGHAIVQPEELRVMVHRASSPSSPSPNLSNSSSSGISVANRVTSSAPKSEPANAVAKPLAGLRIFFAEDGPDNQRLVGFHLRRAGADVRMFDNGRLALEALSAGGDIDGELLVPAPCDVILTDMQMPEMDGYSLARTLRTKGWTGGIVALTAHAMAGDAEKCIAAGCDLYATKPIDAAALIAICRQAVAIGREAVPRQAA
ncbi:MAG: ATP-binding protein [Planctomycetota bacterium]|nr:ATP-binding protein [Planctomycetota bacterium]